jgi:hypothetical protein
MPTCVLTLHPMRSKFPAQRSKHKIQKDVSSQFLKRCWENTSSNYSQPSHIKVAFLKTEMDSLNFFLAVGDAQVEAQRCNQVIDCGKVLADGPCDAKSIPDPVMDQAH